MKRLYPELLGFDEIEVVRVPAPSKPLLQDAAGQPGTGTTHPVPVPAPDSLSTRNARKLGCLQGVAEVALAYLCGDTTISREVVIEGLARAFKHDGSKEYRLFHEPPPRDTRELIAEANHAFRAGEPWED